MSGTKSEMKKWAKEHIKGVENSLFPSFDPELKVLDEDGIRLDVRQSIKHGFFSTMCATETGLSMDEIKRFVEIAADEAGDDILVTTAVILNSFEENMELVEHAEKVGLHGILLGYPPTFHPETAEEVFEATKRFCDATNLHVTLYPSPHFHFAHLHNSGFPLQILPRLADLPNVVAIKVGEMGLYADMHRLVGDQVLVGCPVERYVPLLIEGFDMQWMGAGCYEVFQSPEKPYLVDYFNLLLEGKKEPAMEIYWKIAPMRNIFEQQFNQTVMTGTYNWHQQKYYQWCVGGNGGLTRQPAMKAHQWERDAIKMGFYTIDITPRENDEEFFVGRLNYEKMQAEKGMGTRIEGPIEVVAQPIQTSGSPIERAYRLSLQLEDDLSQTQVELKKVPALIRPMAAGSFKNRSGRSVADWIERVNLLSSLLKNGDGRAAERLNSDLPDIAESLDLLRTYYRDAPVESAKNIRDEKVRREMAAQMAKREVNVRGLIAVLGEID
jgi:4-hydroxy-tetrahydrodipicolinate synthase